MTSSNQISVSIQFWSTNVTMSGQMNNVKNYLQI